MKEADRLAEAVAIALDGAEPAAGHLDESTGEWTGVSDYLLDAVDVDRLRNNLAAYRARPQSSDALDGQAALDEANNAVVDRDREIAMLRPVAEAVRPQYRPGCDCRMCEALSRLDGGEGATCETDYTPPLTADGSMKARLTGEGSLPPPAWDDAPAPCETCVPASEVEALRDRWRSGERSLDGSDCADELDALLARHGAGR